jgi:hypothetical protein
VKWGGRPWLARALGPWAEPAYHAFGRGRRVETARLGGGVRGLTLEGAAGDVWCGVVWCGIVPIGVVRVGCVGR